MANHIFHQRLQLGLRVGIAAAACRAAVLVMMLVRVALFVAVAAALVFMIVMHGTFLLQASFFMGIIHQKHVLCKAPKNSKMIPARGMHFGIFRKNC